ncbi:MAG: hypothetical protein LQ351_006169 [Letrouitia transgressa]|nr:MAG: hypothetical protein LQ351_006169 [Letrouitia transgressa]
MESTHLPSQAPRQHKRKTASRPDSGFASASSSTPPSLSRSTTSTSFSSHRRTSQSTSSSPHRCYPSSTSPSRPQRRRERHNSFTSTTAPSYRSQRHRPETADPYLHHRIALRLFAAPQTAYPATPEPISVIADEYPAPVQDQLLEDTQPKVKGKAERQEEDVVAREVRDWTAVPAVRDESGAKKSFWRRKGWGRKGENGHGYEEEDGGSVRRYRLSDQDEEGDNRKKSNGRRWRSLIGGGR